MDYIIIIFFLYHCTNVLTTLQVIYMACSDCTIKFFKLFANTLAMVHLDSNLKHACNVHTCIFKRILSKLKRNCVH